MKHSSKIVLVLSVLLLLILGGVLLRSIMPVSDVVGNSREEHLSADGTETVGESAVLDDPSFLNGRDPSTFTWEEYQNLTPEQQAEFPDYFTSLDAFYSWYQKESDHTKDQPADESFLGGRSPETFTWQEYTQLTPDQQIAFPDYFESLDAYNDWYQATYEKPEEFSESVPPIGDYLNGRDPSSLTWEEYQNLSSDQQAELPDYFESMDAFERWYNSVSDDEVCATEDPVLDDEFLRGRNPADFTWEEYQNLTPEQRVMFPDFFESYDAFLEWEDRAKP